MATVIFGDFEWDAEKASANRRKHGVSFEEAAEAMRDPHSVDFDDIAHPENIVTLAMSPRDRIRHRSRLLKRTASYRLTTRWRAVGALLSWRIWRDRVGGRAARRTRSARLGHSLSLWTIYRWKGLFRRAIVNRPIEKASSGRSPEARPRCRAEGPSDTC